MTQNFAAAGVYLIQTFFGLYTIIIMLRFLMQASKANYYNPICQAIVKTTNPAIQPFKALLPTVYSMDIATLTVAFLVQLVAVMLIMMLKGASVFMSVYLSWVLLGLGATLVNIYFFALIIMVIASWLVPYSSHPALLLIGQIIEPICTPTRKLLPPVGGMDFSVILVFVLINIIDNILIIAPLKAILQIPQGIILGL